MRSWSAAEDAVQQALRRLADEIAARLRERYPLVLSVMGGSVVFTGQLLPLLHFPLDFDYLHVTRYDGATRGGHADLESDAAPDRGGPGGAGAGRHPGRRRHDGRDPASACSADGAAEVYCAVFADKDLGRAKPIRADFVGVSGAGPLRVRLRHGRGGRVAQSAGDLCPEGQ